MSAIDKRPQGATELEYNVFVTGTIASGAYLAKQSVRIVNPNAWFIMTGISGAYDFVGLPAFLLYDANLQKLANEPVWMENFANFFGLACPLSGGFIEYPPDSVIQFDVSERSSAGASTWSLNFWGFLRFEKGVKPC
jgi:hypothetical protein